MRTVETDNLTEILNRVMTLSPASRITLAKRILETLETSQPIEPKNPTSTKTQGTRGWPVERRLGLLKTDRVPPDDEECRQIIEEERWKKYGA